MSQPTDFTARPAMSDADTELTLVACDGTKFSVRSTQLERLSDVFRLMLELPKPDAADTTVHLSEDATTLRALLELTTPGVRLAGRINSLSLLQLERLMTAADKYDIPSARPIVASCLQRRADDPEDPQRHEVYDPWHLFGIVKRFGFTDLEASVRPKLLQSRLDSTPYSSYLSGADVYGIMLERKQHVDDFCYALTSEGWDTPFAVYNREFHMCPSCGTNVSGARTAWSELKVAAILAYNAEPYVEMLLQNEDFLRGPLKRLYETTCTNRRSYLCSCGQCRLRECEGFKFNGRTTRF